MFKQIDEKICPTGVTPYAGNRAPAIDKRNMKDIAILFFLLLNYSCNHEVKIVNEPTVEQDVEAAITYDSLVKNVIKGDFDGDGNRDELSETLISRVDNKSIDVLPKLEYDSLLSVIAAKNPTLSLRSSSKNIPELILSEEPSFGLFWIKNEGDLDHDGSDELSVVIDWADLSQCNTCQVYSFKENKWYLFAQFDVREWQLERNSDFKGFILKNGKGFQVATFDSEINEICKPLNDVVLTYD